MTTDECFNEMAKVLGFPKPDETGYIAILEKVKELTEQLKKQNKDYDDLVPDGVECETFAWIEDRLAKMDVMEEVKDDLENKVLHLESENDELQKKIDDMESEVLDAQDSYALQKQTEQVYYHGEPLMCIEDGTPITISDVFPNKFIKENKKLKDERVCLVGVCKGMKWNDAKSFIIEKHSEKYWREWIHRVEWGTEGEVKEEVEVVQDLNGDKVKIPSEEELKVLGISKEDFIMIAKNSVCYDVGGGATGVCAPK
jgi:predicted RNase H-like nuclease (RuvC/YqgF family)